MDHHLAGEAGAGNSRNGYGRKSVATDTGRMALEVPRDRQGSFDPLLIAKYQRRFPGFDDKIISMDARGMSTREIAGHLLDLYGVEVSPDLISTVAEPPVNRKRIFRLMRLSSLLLQPHTGRRPIRAHEGTVVAPASNQRRASDGLEISCWNGEVVRVAFAIDTHDREIIAWVATSGSGISGEMIRDMMLDCVERRFDTIRAPQPVQWLADNGSAYTAAETIDFAAALNLVPCFTPVRSPESNGVCEAFVKTLKRDYARVNPRPDAISVLQQIPAWFEDYNTVHPTLAYACARRVSSSHCSQPTKPLVRFDGGHSMPETDGDKPARKRFKAYPIGHFHIDIAEVRTEQGKLHLFVAIDRTSKFAFAQLHERATTRITADFLRALLQAVPYRVHTVLTDNGQHFTTPGNIASAAPLIREAMDRGEIFRAHSFELACAQNRIEHRLTKPYHPWTNGQVERMNRTLKEATVQRYHYASHDELRGHLALFRDAYNYARRLKALKGLTPYEFICRSWAAEPHRFTANPHHEMPGPNI